MAQVPHHPLRDFCVGTGPLDSSSLRGPIVFHHEMQHFAQALLHICFQNEFCLLLYSDQAFSETQFWYNTMHSLNHPVLVLIIMSIHLTITQENFFMFITF